MGIDQINGVLAVVLAIISLVSTLGVAVASWTTMRNRLDAQDVRMTAIIQLIEQLGKRIDNVDSALETKIDDLSRTTGILSTSVAVLNTTCSGLTDALKTLQADVRRPPKP